jgi:hypothetical protein
MKNQTQLARAAACLLLAASSLHVHAQNAADPQAAVPATSYQSTLGKAAEAAPSATPDANWVKSNETVAATNSMALTMKPKAGQAADPHAGHVMPAQQSADPHAGHAQHDHAAMQGMDMDKKDGPAMCAPGDKSGQGKMSCCGSGCASCCCMDKMKKKEATCA